MDFRNILVLSAFFINFLISSLIYLRSAKTNANISFFLTAFGISMWCLAMVFYRASDVATSVIAAKMLFFFQTFIPTAFLLFGLYFPRHTVNTTVLITIIFSNILMAFFTLLDGAVIKEVMIIPEQEKKIIFGPAFYLFYIFYFPAVFVSSYVVLFRKYLKESPIVRVQILYILLGISAASVPAMVTNLSLPAFGYFELNWVGQLFTIFWVGAVSYAIVKHRFIDTRLVIARSIAYSLLVLILGVVYTGGLFIAGRYILKIQTPEENLLTSTILALVIAFSFQPLKQMLEQITDTVFYKGRYDPQLLLGKLSRIMASTAFFSYMSELLLKELLSQMRISFGFLTIIQKGEITSIRGEGDTHRSFDFDKRSICSLVTWTVERPGENITVSDELEDSDEKEIMRVHNLSIILPLIVKNEVIGAILLGDKSSGEIYSSKDIGVLKILAPEVAVAVNNALSFEEIANFNIRLEKEIEDATAELQSANTRLKELDRLKDEFVSLASHELRTPMTVIKDYLWVILQEKTGSFSEKQKEYLQRAYSSTERLIRLINAMLNVSRIESGRIVLSVQPLDITLLIQKAIGGMQVNANEHGITLTFHMPFVSIPKVIADSERIEEVIINLVENALKFTPAGGKVDIALSTNERMVIVSVRDTGKGIRQQDLPKLFQKFGVINSEYAKEHHITSSGLGLYISKSLIELHGGKLWAESEGENKGATFRFSLKIYE